MQDRGDGTLQHKKLWYLQWNILWKIQHDYLSILSSQRLWRDLDKIWIYYNAYTRFLWFLLSVVHHCFFPHLCFVWVKVLRIRQRDVLQTRKAVRKSPVSHILFLFHLTTFLQISARHLSRSCDGFQTCAGCFPALCPVRSGTFIWDIPTSSLLISSCSLQQQSNSRPAAVLHSSAHASITVWCSITRQWCQQRSCFKLSLLSLGSHTSH